MVFSLRVGGAVLNQELDEPPGGMDGRSLGGGGGGREIVIFEDMPVSPAMEKLIGQYKLCARNGVKDLAINCRFICTRAALARYKLCFNPLKQYCSMTRLITRR